jgi:hypothetical protein
MVCVGNHLIQNLSAILNPHAVNSMNLLRSFLVMFFLVVGVFLVEVDDLVIRRCKFFF